MLTRTLSSSPSKRRRGWRSRSWVSGETSGPERTCRRDTRSSTRWTFVGGRTSASSADSAASTAWRCSCIAWRMGVVTRRSDATCAVTGPRRRDCSPVTWSLTGKTPDVTRLLQRCWAVTSVHSRPSPLRSTKNTSIVTKRVTLRSATNVRSVPITSASWRSTPGSTWTEEEQTYRPGAVEKPPGLRESCAVASAPLCRCPRCTLPFTWNITTRLRSSLAASAVSEPASATFSITTKNCIAEWPATPLCSARRC